MMNKEELPLGLAFGLSMDEEAMERYANMTEEEKRQVIDRAKNVKSKDEMKAIVEHLRTQ